MYLNIIYDVLMEIFDDLQVYDDNGRLTGEARTYCNDSDELQKNHPLKIMVKTIILGIQKIFFYHSVWKYQ